MKKSVSKRTVALLLFGLFVFLPIMAQDIITKKNAEEIEAVVELIGEETITYKLYSNPNGPSYVIRKSEVLFIKYQNGTKEVFNTSSATAPVSGAIENSGYLGQGRMAYDYTVVNRADSAYRAKWKKHSFRVRAGSGFSVTKSFVHGTFDGDISYLHSYFSGNTHHTELTIGVGASYWTGNDTEYTLKQSYFTIPFSVAERWEHYYFSVNVVPYINMTSTLDGEDIILDTPGFRTGLGMDFGYTVKGFDVSARIMTYYGNIMSHYGPFSFGMGISLGYRL